MVPGQDANPPVREGVSKTLTPPKKHALKFYENTKRSRAENLRKYN
jgi:hypothetical protein